ncbi:hypothetical protein [Phenylobacterium montanum]|uniref:Uncharacterized protein n=1 Tax=Phenylobacterium montanum TaxID=2823693 RepID=A0A975FY61_9CAUL|nr:hypothetical protein [Caulobacter sp. S6]QUD87590.1 hypothetical protein KCG34_21470 [Caulobacter sp. S6]
MSNNTEPFGFIAFKFDERTKSPKGFILTYKRSELDLWLAQPNTSESEGAPGKDRATSDRAEEGVEQSESETLSRLLKSYSKSMSSIRSTFTLTLVLGPAMQVGTINTSLIPHAEKHLTKLADDEKSKIYSFSIADSVEIARKVNKYMETKDGFDQLPSAILLTIGAIFDSQFSEILKYFLSIRPERYKSSDKALSLKEIFSMKSLDDVIEKVIVDEIADKMRGSHAEQIDFVEKQFDVDIISSYSRWPEFIEIFERRNLAAHGNLVVNGIYLKKCAAAGAGVNSLPKIDAKLEIDAQYLNSSVDILTEFGLLLISTLWRKHKAPNDEASFQLINDLCVTFIKEKRYMLAIRLLESGLQKKKVVCPDIILKMMTVNLANAHKKAGNIAKCKDILDNADFSAANDSFQLCVAALHEDIPRVISLMAPVAQGGQVHAGNFRDWPVLDWVRDHPDVVVKFEEVYGEPIQKKVDEDIRDEIIVEDVADLNDVDDTGTVH